MAIRTGPAEFSQRLVTPAPAGGHCPPHLQFRGWRLVHRASGKPIDTPDEQSLFAAIGLRWIAPEERR